jgi:hypothetical protein
VPNATRSAVGRSASATALGVGGRERGGEQRAPLLPGHAREPEPAERAGDAHRGHRLAGRAPALEVRGPGEGGAHLVDVVLHARDRAAARGAEEQRLGLGGEAGHPAGVARARLALLRGAAEQRGAVLPHRLEQAVAGVAVVLAHLDERVLDEAAEGGDHVGAAGRLRRGAHRLDGVEGERPAEHRQPAQQRALVLGEQLVAPVEHRAQRAMARQRGAPAAREQGERVVEARGQPLDAEHREHGGRELEGERQAVEARADGGHGRRRALGEGEAGAHRARPLDEQLHRLVAGGHVGAGARRRARERRHGPRHLALHGERLAARGEHGERGGGAQQRVGERRGVVDHVLAVVEHEEGAPAAQRVVQRVGQQVARRGAHLERGGDGGGHVAAAGHGGELHPPHAVGVRRGVGRGGGERRGHLARQARLAGTAGADHGDEARAAERPRQLRHLAPAPDERRERRGHVVRHGGPLVGGEGGALGVGSGENGGRHAGGGARTGGGGPVG